MKALNGVAQDWAAFSRSLGDPYAKLFRKHSNGQDGVVRTEPWLAEMGSPNDGGPGCSLGALDDAARHNIQNEFRFPESSVALLTFAETATRVRLAERTLRLLVSRYRTLVMRAGRRLLVSGRRLVYLGQSFSTVLASLGRRKP